MFAEPLADRDESAKPLPTTRSAVSNGRRMFVMGDGNSAWSRRYRDLVHDHAADLGGMDSLSQAQVSLIRRACALQVELESMEGRASMGEQLDITQYSTATNTLKRLHEVLGVERKPRDALDLNGYLAGLRRQAEEDAS